MPCHSEGGDLVNYSGLDSRDICFRPAGVYSYTQWMKMVKKRAESVELVLTRVPDIYPEMARRRFRNVSPCNPVQCDDKNCCGHSPVHIIVF